MPTDQINLLCFNSIVFYNVVMPAPTRHKA
jgi:hypothetical protein